MCFIYYRVVQSRERERPRIWIRGFVIVLMSDELPTNKFSDEPVEAPQGEKTQSARTADISRRAVPWRKIYEGYFKFIKIFVFAVVA